MRPQQSSGDRCRWKLLHQFPRRLRWQTSPSVHKTFPHELVSLPNDQDRAGAPAITPEAIAFLQSQTWPGNVRELENTVRKALLIARDYTISLEHVKGVLDKAREPVATSQQTHAAYISNLMDHVERGEVRNAFTKLLADLEPELYRQAIARAQGNITKAAHWLGVTRLKMREKLKEFGLHPKQENETE